MPDSPEITNSAIDLSRQLDYWAAQSQHQVIFIKEQLEKHARSLPNWPLVRSNLRELHRHLKTIKNRNQLLRIELNDHANCIPGEPLDDGRARHDLRPTRSLNEPR